MLYSLSKDFTFEASHQLPDHDGKCRRLHGHSWRVTVTVWGRHLAQAGPKTGMLMDYGDVKGLVAPLIERLDHSHLNDSLAGELADYGPPTSEAIGGWLFRKIRDALTSTVDHAARAVSLKSVTVHETCTSACTVEA